MRGEDELIGYTHKLWGLQVLKPFLKRELRRHANTQLNRREHATIASVAPTLGPIIGGWITDTLNWHWLFYVNLAPGIAITLLAPLLSFTHLRP